MKSTSIFSWKEKNVKLLLKIEELKRASAANLKKTYCQKNDAFEATYRVALLLGKRGNPFSDVDIIKESIIEVVSCIHAENIRKYKELPLSQTTITCCQHELAYNLKQQLNFNNLNKSNILIQNLFHHCFEKTTNICCFFI